MSNFKNLSIKELRERGQATAPNPTKETRVGRFTRVFSVYSTWLFIRTSFTPNQISVLSALVYVAGLLVLFSPDYSVTLLAPVLYFLSIVLDGSDGEVSRIKNIRTRFGGPYVEPAIHDNLYPLTFIICSVVVFLDTNNFWVLLFGTAAAISKTLYRLLQIRFWNVAHRGTSFAAKEAQNEASSNRGFVRKVFDTINANFFSYCGIFLPFAAAVAFQKLDWFVYFYGIGFTAFYLLLLLKHSYLVATDTTPPESW